MSWITGLAGKAEHLLNNIDQAAGQALTADEAAKQLKQKQPSQFSSTVRPHESSYNPYLSQKSTAQSQHHTSHDPLSHSMSSSSSVPSNLNHMDGDNASSGMTQMSNSMYSPSSSSSQLSSKGNGNKKDKDEDLFAFLNNPDADNGTKKKAQVKSVLNGNGKHSRQSSSSSTHSSKSAKTPENGANMETAITITPSDRSDQSGTEPSTADMHDDLLGGNDSSSGYHSNQDDGANQQQLSSLELENRLLKNEVSSLNQEMTTVIQRTKAATEELTSVRRKLEHQQKQLSSSDQVVRELRARENDMAESAQAKDSQLAILRVRLEEADRELEEKRRSLKHIEDERNRILHDHTSASDVQGQALDTMKDKLREAQLECKREKEAYAKLRQEYSERQATLESSQHELGEALAAAQKALADEKRKHTELTAQASSARQAAQTARRELQDYKDKATRILQSKDKLIASLKDGASPSSSMSGELSSSAITSVELEEVQGERSLLREELAVAQAALEGVRAELSELETQAQQDGQAAQEAQEALEAQYATERTRREEIEQEVAQCRQELRYVNEELLKQKTAFQSRLKDRDVEIERLRNQLTTKSHSSNSQTELENRLHALTESLIQKQTMLEALSTEKSSLSLQLERMEKQYRELETNAIRSASTTVNMADNDEVRQRLPGFLRESPADGDVARKVKRAAGSIDKFSIRLGVFLRRYPIARVMVICYMVLLHFWVLFVLMTYQPEIHGLDHLDSNPQPPH